MVRIVKFHMKIKRLIIHVLQEGFLLGEVEDRTTSTVSDSQDVTVKHHRIFGEPIKVMYLYQEMLYL